MGGATAPNITIVNDLDSFNAARGFVGGATELCMQYDKIHGGFNAARGFVGGATI